MFEWRAFLSAASHSNSGLLTVKSVTWQVDRCEFDLMLLDNSAEHGVEVCQQANVQQVRFEGERATGVAAVFTGGERRRIDARVVIDASGQTGLISRHLRLKEVDPVLRHTAFHTRYRGAWRGEASSEVA